MSSSFFRSRRSAPRGFGVDLSNSDAQLLSRIRQEVEDEAFGGMAARDAAGQAQFDRQYDRSSMLEAKRRQQQRDAAARSGGQSRDAIDASLLEQGIDAEAIRAQLKAEGVPVDASDLTPREIQGLDYRQEDKQLKDISRAARKKRMGEDEFGGDAGQDQNFGGFVNRQDDRSANQLELMAKELQQAEQDPDMRASYDEKREKQGTYQMPRQGPGFKTTRPGRQTPRQYAEERALSGYKGQALGDMPRAQKIVELEKNIDGIERGVYEDYGVDPKQIPLFEDDVSIDPQGRDMLLQDFGLMQGGNESIERGMGDYLVTDFNGNPVLDAQGRQKINRGRQNLTAKLEGIDDPESRRQIMGKGRQMARGQAIVGGGGTAGVQDALQRLKQAVVGGERSLSELVPGTNRTIGQQIERMEQSLGGRAALAKDKAEAAAAVETANRRLQGNYNDDDIDFFVRQEARRRGADNFASEDLGTKVMTEGRLVDVEGKPTRIFKDDEGKPTIIYGLEGRPDRENKGGGPLMRSVQKDGALPQGIGRERANFEAIMSSEDSLNRSYGNYLAAAGVDNSGITGMSSRLEPMLDRPMQAPPISRDEYVELIRGKALAEDAARGVGPYKPEQPGIPQLTPEYDEYYRAALEARKYERAAETPIEYESRIRANRERAGRQFRENKITQSIEQGRFIQGVDADGQSIQIPFDRRDTATGEVYNIAADDLRQGNINLSRTPTINPASVTSVQPKSAAKYMEGISTLQPDPRTNATPRTAIIDGEEQFVYYTDPDGNVLGDNASIRVPEFMTDDSLANRSEGRDWMMNNLYDRYDLNKETIGEPEAKNISGAMAEITNKMVKEGFELSGPIRSLEDLEYEFQKGVTNPNIKFTTWNEELNKAVKTNAPVLDDLFTTLRFPPGQRKQIARAFFQLDKAYEQGVNLDRKFMYERGIDLGQTPSAQPTGTPLTSIEGMYGNEPVRGRPSQGEEVARYVPENRGATIGRLGREEMKMRDGEKKTPIFQALRDLDPQARIRQMADDEILQMEQSLGRPLNNSEQSAVRNRVNNDLGYYSVDEFVNDAQMPFVGETLDSPAKGMSDPEARQVFQGKTNSEIELFYRERAKKKKTAAIGKAINAEKRRRGVQRLSGTEMQRIREEAGAAADLELETTINQRILKANEARSAAAAEAEAVRQRQIAGMDPAFRPMETTPPAEAALRRESLDRYINNAEGDALRNALSGVSEAPERTVNPINDAVNQRRLTRNQLLGGIATGGLGLAGINAIRQEQERREEEQEALASLGYR